LLNILPKGLRLSRAAGKHADVFFHRSAMVGRTAPEIDMVCEFVEERGPNGRLRAVNVRPI
jgi:hypothetical protein